MLPYQLSPEVHFFCSFQAVMLLQQKICALLMAFSTAKAALNDSTDRNGICRSSSGGQTSCSSPEERNLSCERVQNCKALGGSQSPSIAIRDSNGRLGNQMFVYQLLLSLRMQFGYRTYITRRVVRD